MLRPDLGIAALLLLPLVLYPLARDQGVFAYAGAVILDGGLPYADVFDTKGPAMHYTYALAMALFGRSMLAVRAFFALLTWLGVALAAWLAERTHGAAARLPTIVAMCVVTGSSIQPAYVPWHLGGQAEDVLTLMLLAVVAVSTTGAGLTSIARWGVVGLIFGASLMFKPVLLPTAVLLGGYGVWWARVQGGLPWSDVAVRVATAVGGGVVVPLGTMAWFFVHGALDDLLQFAVWHARGYAARRTPLVGMLWYLFFSRPGLWLTGAAAVALSLRPGNRSPVTTMTVLAMGGAWLGVYWQGKYFPYHLTPLWLLAAFLVGSWLGRLAGALPAPPVLRGTAAALVAALVVGSSTSAYGVVLMQTAEVVTGQRTLDSFRGPFMTGQADWTGLSEVVQAVHARTDPDDAIVVWGHETLLHFVAERRAPSCFTIDGPLTVPGPFREQYRERYLGDLASDPPELFIVLHDDVTPIEAEDSATSLAGFAALQAYVHQHYTLAERHGDFAIWQRTDP